MNRRIGQNRLKPAPTPAARVTPAQRHWNARAWREQHASGMSSSLQRLAARPLATTLTLTVLALALTLPVLFWLLLDNAKSLGGSVDDARAISVFVKPDLDAAAVQSLAAQVRARDDVASVAVKTPEQGLEEFRSQSGFADALKVLHYNPLPAVLVVIARADGAALVAELQRDRSP